MRLALFLLALAAMLSWFRPVSMPEPEIIAPRAATQTSRTPTTPSPTASPAAAALAPPLFRPSQTPASLATPRAGETFALVGLVTRAGQRVAFLRDTIDGQAWTAREGEAVGDWQLTAFSERCVTLERRRQRREVCL